MRGRAKKARGAAKKSLLAKARKIESRLGKSRRQAKKTVRRKVTRAARTVRPAKKHRGRTSKDERVRAILAHAASARRLGNTAEAETYERRAAAILENRKENPMKTKRRRRKGGKRAAAKRNPMKHTRKRSHKRKRNPTSGAIVPYKARKPRRKAKGGKRRRSAARRSGRGTVHLVSNVRVTGPTSRRSHRSKKRASTASGSKRSRRIAKKALRTRRKPRLVRSSTSWRAPHGRSTATVTRFYPAHNPMIDASAMHLVVGALSLGTSLFLVDMIDKRIAVMTPTNGNHAWIGHDAVLRQMQKPGAARLGTQLGVGVVGALATKMLASRSPMAAFVVGGLAAASLGTLVYNGLRWYLAPMIWPVTNGNEVNFGNEVYPIEQTKVQTAIAAIVKDQDAAGKASAGQDMTKDANGNVIVTGYDYAGGGGSPVPTLVLQGPRRQPQGKACPKCGKTVGFGCGCRAGASGVSSTGTGKDVRVPVGMSASVVSMPDGSQVIQVRPAGASSSTALMGDPNPAKADPPALPPKNEVVSFPTRRTATSEARRARPFG